MKAKMLGALGAQSSLDNGDKVASPNQVYSPDKKGWSAMRQASQDSNNAVRNAMRDGDLTEDEAATIIQACKTTRNNSPCSSL